MAIPGFIDPGWLGSPVDVATFVVVVTLFAYELRPRVRTLAAAVVALARRTDDVDDDRLVAELDVDETEVAALETTIVRKDEGGDGP
jgi:hypothetical protein